jgi:hypothetical protein
MLGADTCICDDDVEFSEVRRDLVDCGGYFGGGGNVCFVGSAFCVVGLGEFGGCFGGGCGCIVYDCDLSRVSFLNTIGREEVGEEV